MCRYAVFFALACAVSVMSLAVKIHLLVRRVRIRRRAQRNSIQPILVSQQRKVTIAGVEIASAKPLSPDAKSRSEDLRTRLDDNLMDRRKYYCTRPPHDLLPNVGAVHGDQYVCRLFASGPVRGSVWPAYFAAPRSPLTSDYRLINLRSTALCPTLLGRLRSVQASGIYEHVLPLYVAA